MTTISTSAFRQFSALDSGEQEYCQETLPLDAIDPHPANRPINPQKTEKLAATIERDGLGQLPLVRAMPNGRYQMVAGHHRLEAFRLLAQRTGNPKWKSIPVNVMRECDDERALCLLHMTNLVAPDLNKEEIGRAYEAIAAIVSKEREADPKRFAGVPTNRIVAEISTEQGRKAGITFVKEARRAYRESLARDNPNSASARPAYRRPSEATLAADAMQRSLERIETLSPESLAPVAKRLARYHQRLQTALKKCST